MSQRKDRQGKDKLEVVDVMKDDNGEILKESKDGRRYMTVYFRPVPPPGLLSNAKPRGKNIWEEGPLGSRGDALFDQLLREDEKSIKTGAKVIGSVETIETEPYFIPNENGKHEHPETGEPCNVANTYTSVVFEDENIERLAKNQGYTPKGDEEVTEVEQQQSIEEEVGAESQQEADRPDEEEPASM